MKAFQVGLKIYSSAINLLQKLSFRVLSWVEMFGHIFCKRSMSRVMFNGKARSVIRPKFSIRAMGSKTPRARQFRMIVDVNAVNCSSLLTVIEPEMGN
jgi:hypothetical protein